MDNAFTRQLVSDLERLGASVWVDYDPLNTADFAKGINDGLGNCEWVLLIQTPEALKSDWVREEVEIAANLRVNRRIHGIIPIIAADCTDLDLPPMWEVLHNYDARTDYARALHGLARALRLNQASNVSATLVTGSSSSVPNLPSDFFIDDRSDEPAVSTNDLPKYIGIAIAAIAFVGVAWAYLDARKSSHSLSSPQADADLARFSEIASKVLEYKDKHKSFPDFSDPWAFRSEMRTFINDPVLSKMLDDVKVNKNMGTSAGGNWIFIWAKKDDYGICNIDGSCRLAEQFELPG